MTRQSTAATSLWCCLPSGQQLSQSHHQLCSGCPLLHIIVLAASPPECNCCLFIAHWPPTTSTTRLWQTIRTCRATWRLCAPWRPEQNMRARKNNNFQPRSCRKTSSDTASSNAKRKPLQNSPLKKCGTLFMTEGRFFNCSGNTVVSNVRRNAARNATGLSGSVSSTDPRTLACELCSSLALWPSSSTRTASRASTAGLTCITRRTRWNLLEESIAVATVRDDMRTSLPLTSWLSMS